MEKGKKYKLSLIDIDDIFFYAVSAQQADSFYTIISTYEDNPLYIEKIFNHITDSQYNIDDLPAGIALIVIYASLKISGYIKDVSDFPDIIDQSRSKINTNTFFSIYSAISKVCPSYKLEELKLMTNTELFELLAFSEKVSGVEIFDTKKMRSAIEAENSPQTTASKKGIAGVTKDEIELLQDILAKEEFQFQGMPNY